MDFLKSVIHQVLGLDLNVAPTIRPVGGGCINNTGAFELHGKTYFLKWNGGAEELFEKEHKGLELLGKSKTLGVPKVLGRGTAGLYSFLCLEYLERANSDEPFWELFGRQLASLHKNHHESFGLDFDNHIGRLPQSNKSHTRWASFFIEERLAPQIKMAMDQGRLDAGHVNLFEQFYAKVGSLFPEETPSLVHGDLWSGNAFCVTGGKPFVFDPAVHYGHRESELAFTTMFGGFDQKFYDAYQEAFPLQAGFEERIDLYNLYPLLVHVNLFGTSYLDLLVPTLKRYV